MKPPSRPKPEASQTYVARGAAGGRMSPRPGSGEAAAEAECGGCCGCGDTFLTSPTGLVKLAELTAAVVCQFLLLHYGVE